MNDLTQLNIKKVTRYRPDGEDSLRDMVQRFRKLGEWKGMVPNKEKVYPDPVAPDERQQRVERVKEIEKNAPWW
jgi:hypothetical protein